jgi:phosphate-selective porin OprO/OprP
MTSRVAQLRRIVRHGKPPQRVSRSWPARTAWALAACLAAGTLCAQSPESMVTPESEHLVKDADHYAIPDVSDKSLQKVKVAPEHEKYLIKFGLAVLGDYTAFTQDANSKQQVGNQSDKFEVRSARFLIHGYFKLGLKWNYFASYEYKGFDKNPGDPLLVRYRRQHLNAARSEARHTDIRQDEGAVCL